MLFLVKSLGGQVIHHEDKKEPVYVSFTFYRLPRHFGMAEI